MAKNVSKSFEATGEKPSQPVVATQQKSACKRSGGAFAINGFLYQLLSSISWASQIIINDRTISENDLRSLRITLEPSAGGDAHHDRLGKKTVVQFKTRTRGVWTVSQIVREVLPDLYNSTHDIRAEAYQFRSDAEVRLSDAFKSLVTLLRAGTLAQALSDATTKRLRFRAKGRVLLPSAFFRWAGSIAANMSEAKFARDQSARERFAHLLVSFECPPPISSAELVNAINHALRKVIPNPERCSAKREQLIGLLLGQAAHGNAMLSVVDILEQCGISFEALKSISGFEENLKREFDQKLSLLGYSRQADCRVSPRVEASSRPVAICGVSGVGKTWALARAASDALAMGALCIWLDAPTNVYDVRQHITNCIQAARGHTTVENPLGLRILLSAVQKAMPYRLCVFMDRFTTPEQAIEILSASWWAEQNIQLVAALPASTPDNIAIPDGITRFDMDEFSFFELRDFMRKRKVDWLGLPIDLRRLLCRPSLAKIYADGRKIWKKFQPSTEYELVDAVWNRPPIGYQGTWQAAMAAVETRLDSLLNQLLHDEAVTYPWRVGGDENSFSIDQVSLLERHGFMRWATQGRVQLDHDRLLAWGLARAVARYVRKKPTEVPRVTELLEKCWVNTNGLQGLGRHAVGYVPLDTLWLLLDPDKPFAQALDLIAPLVCAQQLLDWKLIATVGPRAFPLLLAAAETLPADSIPFWRDLGKALAETKPVRGLDESIFIALLDSQDEHRRMVMLECLGIRPSRKLLNRIADRYVAIREEQVPGSYTSRRDHWEEEKALFHAAKALVHRFPASLLTLIRQRDPERVGRLAAHLCLELPPTQARRTWHDVVRIAPELSLAEQKTLPDRTILLAQTKKDVQELITRAHADGFAFQALAAFDTKIAAKVLGEVDDNSFWRWLHYIEPYSVFPIAVVGELLARLMECEDNVLALAPPPTSISSQLRIQYWSEILRRIPRMERLCRSHLLGTTGRSVDPELMLLLAASRSDHCRRRIGEFAIDELRAHAGRDPNLDLNDAGGILLRGGGTWLDRLILERLRHPDELQQRLGVRQTLLTDNIKVRSALEEYCQQRFERSAIGKVNRLPFDILALVDSERASALAFRCMSTGRIDAVWLAGEIALLTQNRVLGLRAIELLQNRRPANLRLQISLHWRFARKRDQLLELANRALRTGDSMGRALAVWVGIKLKDVALLTRVENALVKSCETSIDGHDSYTFAQLSADPAIGPRLLDRIKRGHTSRLLRSVLTEFDPLLPWFRETQMSTQAVDAAFQFESNFLNTPNEGQKVLWKLDKEIAFETFEEGLHRGGRASKGLAAIAVAADCERATDVILRRLKDVSDDKVRADLARALRARPSKAKLIRKVLSLLRSEDEQDRLTGIFVSGWLGDNHLDKEIIALVRTETRSAVVSAVSDAIRHSNELQDLASLAGALKRSSSPSERRRMIAVLAGSDKAHVFRHRDDPLCASRLIRGDREWKVFDEFLCR